jgi:hypothetical protein
MDREGDTDRWLVDHSVRRFIRPLLMRDPQPALDQAQSQQTAEEGVEEVFDTSGTTKMAAGKTTKKKATKVTKTPNAS